MITGVSGAICGRAAVCRRLPPCRYNGHILHELILARQHLADILDRLDLL
jgi:hypothetical protein